MGIAKRLEYLVNGKQSRKSKTGRILDLKRMEAKRADRILRKCFGAWLEARYSPAEYDDLDETEQGLDHLRSIQKETDG